MSQPTGPQLRRFLKERQITRQEAATLVDVSLESMHKYCLPTKSRQHRRMPARTWELLQLKVATASFTNTGRVHHP